MILLFQNLYILFYQFILMNLHQIRLLTDKEHSQTELLFYQIQKRKFKQTNLLQQSNMEKSDQIVVLKLKKIAVISLIFMTIQIVGGALAHSIAIMADAFHLFSDVIAYMVSLYAVLLSKKVAPKYLSFGYEKAQPLGALINVAIIWCVTIELFIQATSRIISKQVVKQPLYMLLTSIFGLGCNLFIMKILHSSEDGHCGHDHGHGHSHGGHSHGGHSHEHNSHKHQKHDHSKKQKKCCQHNNQNIQAVCSCDSPSQINRSTKSSEGQVDNFKSVVSHQNQIPLQLGEDLMPKKKRKGYCAIHSHDKHSHHDHEHHDHDHDHHDHNHHDHDHHDHHGHDHQHDHDDHHKSVFQNINIQAAYIHIISDIILSIGVIVSASVIFFIAGDDKQWSYWQLADPFCTYLFSIVALYSTISIVKQSITMLLDGCQNPQLIRKLQYFLNVLKQNNKNIDIQDLKIWSSNRGKHYCMMRVIMKKSIKNKQQQEEQTQQFQPDNQLNKIYQKIKHYCQQLNIKCYIDTTKK